MGIRFQRKLIEATATWPDYLAKLTPENVVQVDEAARKANDTHADQDTSWEEECAAVDAALQLFNDLTGSFGIAAIGPKELPDSRRRNWRYDFVDYVNTGDSYRATLLFDYYKMQFVVGTVGDYCFETLAKEAYEEGILEEEAE